MGTFFTDFFSLFGAVGVYCICVHVFLGSFPGEFAIRGPFYSGCRQDRYEGLDVHYYLDLSIYTHAGIVDRWGELLDRSGV